MSRLSSKYQITVPKALARQVGFEPGDELICELAGESVQLRPKARAAASGLSVTDRLILFDLATERQRHREHESGAFAATDRGWTREDLYER